MKNDIGELFILEASLKLGLGLGEWVEERLS